jgi:hypothetical protein
MIRLSTIEDMCRRIIPLLVVKCRTALELSDINRQHALEARINSAYGWSCHRLAIRLCVVAEAPGDVRRRLARVRSLARFT